MIIFSLNTYYLSIKISDFINNNTMAIINEFSWEIINQKYYELLKAFKI